MNNKRINFNPEIINYYLKIRRFFIFKIEKDFFNSIQFMTQSKIYKIIHRNVTTKLNYLLKGEKNEI